MTVLDSVKVNEACIDFSIEQYFFSKESLLSEKVL